MSTHGPTRGPIGMLALLERQVGKSLSIMLQGSFFVRGKLVRAERGDWFMVDVGGGETTIVAASAVVAFTVAGAL